ncbi:hypothetical protein AVEN_213440-1 [Araneus ventricosus]|uniref:RING-type domain-containing protein n=1 Tax=Araneus ventricosus TaxID=182803 RepID=A0A4Y2JU29_ARAVE|nr:hypothetical protein AVEN_213440-1 [Araneus ventricosus]
MVNHPMSNEEAEGTSDDTIQCVICWETVSGLNRKSLPCSHVFHENCINEWLESSSSCPVCRSSIHGTNISLQGMVNVLRNYATWTRAATWLTFIVNVFMHSVTHYFVKSFVMNALSHDDVESSGVVNITQSH